MTNVSDFVTYADGRPASGRVVVSWPPFQLDGAAVVGGMQAWDIVNGTLDLSLYANVNARPSGVYYTAVYELEEGALETEYWIIPDRPAVNLGQIKAAFPVAPSVMISALQLTSAGASYGQFLGWDGSHWVPMYASIINVSPNTISLAFGAAGSDLAVSGSPVSLGGTATLNVPDAGAAARGVVSTGVQTFAGAKTFAGIATFSNGIQVSGASTIAGYVPAVRQVATGHGLAGGGPLSTDLLLTAPDNSSVQQVQVVQNSTFVGARHALNFIGGPNITLAITDRPALDWVEVTISATGGGGGGASLPPGVNTGDTLEWQAVPGPGFWSVLPKGAAGMVLTAGASGISWALAIPNGASNGDVLIWNGTAWTPLARGAANQVLTAGSGAISWAAIPAQVPAGATAGDMLVWSGLWATLPRGAAGQVLTASGTGTAWAALPPVSPWTQNMDGGGFQLTNVGKIAAGKATAAYTIDAGGDINTTGVFRVNGVPLPAPIPQTPWAQDIDGASKKLFSVASIAVAKPTAAYAVDVTGDVNVTGSFRVNGTPLPAPIPQTPWGSDINAASNRLYSVLSIAVNKPTASYAIDVTGDINCTGNFRVNGVILAQSPWTGNVDGGNFQLTDVSKIGIGIATVPAYPLDVNGMIRSASGGYRFPDGTVQTTAAAPGSGGVSTQSDATSARAVNTNTYTNSTGKPLFVNVSVSIAGAGSNSVSACTDGSPTPGSVVSYFLNGSTSGMYFTLSFWVLPGNNYRVIGSGITLNKWTEYW